MKIKTLKHIFILLSILFLSSTAFAEIMGGTSVEWMTSASDIVAIGKLEKLKETKGEYSVIYESYSLKVTEIIKGDKRQKKIRFVNRVLSDYNSLKDLAKGENQVLVFLSPYKENDREVFLHGKFVPTNLAYPLSVINLDSPNKYIIDTNFNVLKEREEILEVCRKSAESLKEFLKENPTFKVESGVIEVPNDSEAFRNLYTGSAVFLTVPNFMFPDVPKSIFDFYKKH